MENDAEGSFGKRAQLRSPSFISTSVRINCTVKHFGSAAVFEVMYLKLTLADLTQDNSQDHVTKLVMYRSTNYKTAHFRGTYVCNRKPFY